MIYIENIFICLVIPMLLSSFFIQKKARGFTIFVIIGMGICLLSAYVNSFFMGLCQTNSTFTAIEITPCCEETMKLLPLLFYFLIFEPDKQELPDAAIAIAVGFATFENVCYLTENGAENLKFLLIRGISAGALHLLCGIFSGFSISVVFRYRWLTLIGTISILGACIGFHATYNLLISSWTSWKIVGYLFPSVLIFLLFLLKHIFLKSSCPVEETKSVLQKTQI